MGELLRFPPCISTVILSIFPFSFLFSFSLEDFLHHSHSSTDLVPSCERHCSYGCTKQYFNASFVTSSNLNPDLSACQPQLMSLHFNTSRPSHGLSVSAKGMQGPRRKLDCK